MRQKNPIPVEKNSNMLYSLDQRWSYMPGIQPKKMLILNLLEILKRHTKPGQAITQKKIAEYLERITRWSLNGKRSGGISRS